MCDPGTQIEFVPIVVADVWRATNLLVSLVLIPVWVGNLLDRRIPPYSLWGQASLLALVSSEVALTLQRWHEPFILEVTPVYTVALVCAAMNLLRLRHLTVETDERE